MNFLDSQIINESSECVYWVYLWHCTFYTDEFMSNVRRFEDPVCALHSEWTSSTVCLYVAVVFQIVVITGEMTALLHNPPLYHTGNSRILLPHHLAGNGAVRHHNTCMSTRTITQLLMCHSTASQFYKSTLLGEHWEPTRIAIWAICCFCLSFLFFSFCRCGSYCYCYCVIRMLKWVFLNSWFHIAYVILQSVARL